MRKIIPETIYEYRTVSAPALSADGTKTAFLVTRCDEKTNRNLTDLFTLRGKDLKQLTNAGDVAFFTWTSRGTLLAALRSSEEAQKNKTMLCEIDDEHERQVSAISIPVSVLDAKEIDAHRLLILASCEKPQNTLGGSYIALEDVPFWSNGSFFTNGKRKRLGVFHLDTGALDWVTEPDFEVCAYDCADGRIVYSGGALEALGGDYSRSTGVYAYDLSTGEHTVLLPQGEWLKSRLLGIWGDRVLLALTNGEQLIPDGSGRKYEDDQYDDFYTVNLAGGEPKLLARYEYTIGMGGRTLKADGDHFYFTTTVGEHTFLKTIDEKGVISENLTPEGFCASFDVQDGKLVYCGLFGQETGELYGGDGARLTRFSVIDQFDWRRPKRHSATGKQGHEIRGFVMLPSEYDGQKRYPAILHIHGGPHAAFSDVYDHDMQMWANAGYFVFYCNPRGSTGRGNEYGCIAGQYGEADYDDLMDFTDSVLCAYPAIDPARLAVTGGSYGGYMTNWIIGHTDRFATAIAQCSISNWMTIEHTSDIGPIFVKGQLRATTASDAAELWRRSPLAYASNISTPTLFIHGDQDCRTWMVEGLSMYTALKMNNVPTRLLLYSGEHHGLSRVGKPHNRVGRAKEMLAWFDRYCMKLQ